MRIAGTVHGLWRGAVLQDSDGSRDRQVQRLRLRRDAAAGRRQGRHQGTQRARRRRHEDTREKGRKERRKRRLTVWGPASEISGRAFTSDRIAGAFIFPSKKTTLRTRPAAHCCFVPTRWYA